MDVEKRLSLDGSFWGLLPEEKVALLEEMQAANTGKSVSAFVGDGLNDAPVIARAGVGVSMGKVGSYITVDNADVVIMNDHLSGLPEVLRIARKTRGVIWQNILLSLAVKAAVLALGAFGAATLWEAVFADVGMTILAVINFEDLAMVQETTGRCLRSLDPLLPVRTKTHRRTLNISGIAFLPNPFWGV